MSPSRPQRYAFVAIVLHWLIAAAIVGMIAVGWTMGDMPPGAEQFALVQLHKSVGIAILALSIARIIWRLMNPPPPAPPGPALATRLASLAHAGFYALMILMPLSGWLLVSVSTADVSTRLFSTLPWPHIPGFSGLGEATREAIEEPVEFIHSKLAWVMIALLVLHVLGALRHHFILRDGLLARMAPGLFGPASPPSPAPRGALIAFGAAAALVALVVAAGYAAPQQGPAPQGAASAPSPAPFWDIDPAKSSIRFAGAYMGRPFEGVFGEWTSVVQFDPERPEHTRIRVGIATGSANTGEVYFDENLREGDWFNVANHPDAVFEVNEGVFRMGRQEYEATGVLTIKGVAHPVRLPFTVMISGNEATVNARTSLSRIALGVGADTRTEPQGEEEWVRDDVEIMIALVATRR